MERFAQHLAAHGLPVEAYLHAYDVVRTTNRNALRASAFNIANHPKVRARVAALQAASAERTITTNAELMAALEEVVDTDATEIFGLAVNACRHCHGAHGAYQFRDGDEWALAAAAAIDRGERVPDAAGGFGYRTDAPVNPDCVHCHGLGEQRLHITPTAELSRGARRLIKGFELFPDGRVKRLHLHDQTQLRIELHKLRGMVIDRTASVVAHVNVPSLADIASDPVKALEFLESLRPTKPAPVTVDAAAEPA
jgi:hypothetical protein